MKLILPLLFLSATPAAAQAIYSIEDVGTVSATPSDPVHGFGINNRGHMLVRNQRSIPGGGAWQDRAVFWDGQAGTVITPLIGGSTWPGGLNDFDVCVGQETIDALDWYGFVWTPTQGTTHTLDLGPRDFTFIRAINAHGLLAGDFTSDETYNFVVQNHAFLGKQTGQYVDLESLSQSRSYFRGLNDLEQVIGTSGGINGPILGFVWNFGTGMAALPTLGGNGCVPEGINNHGIIVGKSTNAFGQWRPFQLQQGLMTDLGPLPGDEEAAANNLNDHGTIVGNSGTLGARRATLWSVQGVAQDLNALIPAGSGWTLTNAVAVNELGEISGTGDYQGNTRAFRLQPVLAAPRVSGFQPGIAGEDNRMYGLGFTPGATVELYYGFRAGSTTIPCGATVAIDSANLLLTTTADTEGRIEVPSWLPPAAQGKRPLFQAVEPAACLVGELREQRIL